LEAFVSIAQNLSRRLTVATQGEHQSDITLAVILTCSLMIVVDTTVVNIALPHIQGDLHFSPTGLSWIINAYTLAYGGLLLLGGRVGDILGRRRAFTWGLALFTASSLLGGLALDAGWLIATRAAQGIGAAMAAPNAIALIVTNFAEGPQRNRALGIYSSVVSAGSSIGLIVGGIIVTGLSWRWVLFINVPIGVAAVLLAPRIIKEPERHPGNLDIVGALTGTAGMVALVYGFIRAASNGWDDRMTVGAFSVAVALLTLFLTVEIRSEQPILPLHLLAQRSRASGYLTMLFVAATMFSMFFFLTQFLQDILKFSPLTTAVAFLPWTLTLFTVAQIVPRLVPRFGAKRFIIAGAALITVAMFWLAQINAASSYSSGILGPMVLFGVGMGCIFMPVTMIILTGVQPQDSGAAGGVLQAMLQVGGSLGLAILVTIFGSASRNAAQHPVAHVTPQVQLHDILAQAIGTAFFVGAIFAACALVVAVFVIKTPAPQSLHVEHLAEPSME
jgi:EmrB/QacA subfamily drug resistance transporter